jgi:tetratricopeptide (TPR) repeat protein
MKKLFLLLAVFFMQALQAQQQELELARRYFERTYYSEAIPLYEKASAENRSVEVVKNLADSYYFTNDLKNAERWYRFLIKNLGQNTDEEYYFRYIQTLKASGNYDEATVMAKEFLASHNNSDGLSKLETDLEELENISGIGNRFEIKNLAINTKYSEFGAVPDGENLVFSGVKRNSGVLKKTYKWNDESYLDLLTIPLANLKSGDSTATDFSAEINTSMHEGNAVFTKDGKTVYFTRNNSKNGKKVRNGKKITNQNLYRA